jgi:hypothetical protein
MINDRRYVGSCITNNYAIIRITSCLEVKWEYKILMCLGLIYTKLILKSANCLVVKSELHACLDLTYYKLIKNFTIYPTPKFQYLTHLSPVPAIRHVHKSIAFASFP